MPRPYIQILYTRAEAIRILRAMPPPVRKAIRELAYVFLEELKKGERKK